MTNLPVEVWDRIYKMKRRMEFNDLAAKMDRMLFLEGPMERIYPGNNFERRVWLDKNRYYRNHVWYGDGYVCGDIKCTIFLCFGYMGEDNERKITCNYGRNFYY